MGISWRTAVAVSAGTLGASAVAAAVLAVPSSAAQTLTFTARSLNGPDEGFVDVNGNHVPDAGDSFLVNDTLYTSSGKAAGYDRGMCTLIRTFMTAHGPQGDAECVVTVAIPGGQLTLQGIDKSEGTNVNVAVTGGTGDYTGKQGTAHVTSTPGSNVSTMTITLQ